MHCIMRTTCPVFRGYKYLLCLEAGFFSLLLSFVVIIINGSTKQLYSCSTFFTYDRLYHLPSIVIIRQTKMSSTTENENVNKTTTTMTTITKTTVTKTTITITKQDATKVAKQTIGKTTTINTDITPKWPKPLDLITSNDFTLAASQACYTTTHTITSTVNGVRFHDIYTIEDGKTVGHTTRVPPVPTVPRKLAFIPWRDVQKAAGQACYVTTRTVVVGDWEITYTIEDGMAWMSDFKPLVDGARPVVAPSLESLGLMPFKRDAPGEFVPVPTYYPPLWLFQIPRWLFHIRQKAQLD